MVYWALLLFVIFDAKLEQSSIPSDQSPYYTGRNFKAGFFYISMIKNDLET